MSSKADWKLFREKLPEWQENYMDRLVSQYAAVIASDKPASDKFWELEKRIKKDKKHPGVMVELEKSEMLYILRDLIKGKVIPLSELDQFSDETKGLVYRLLGIDL